MRHVAMLALATLFAASAASAQTPPAGGSGATVALTEGDVAAVALARAIVWRQWMVLEALDAYARDPNVTPEALARAREAAREAWLTRGADALTVPTSGPAALWFTRGADVMAATPSVAYAAPSVAVDAGAGAVAAPFEEPQDASDAADAADDANDAGDASAGDGGSEDAETDLGPIPAPAAMGGAQSAATPPGAAPTSSEEPAPAASKAARNVEVFATTRARVTEGAPASPASRAWLVAPASAAFAVFVAVLAARRARVRT